MTLDEIKKTIELHGSWLENPRQVAFVRFSEANLSGADLSGADLSEANFSERIYAKRI
jgi:uncharacterized protein YjbI with pentapeptide repeats